MDWSPIGLAVTAAILLGIGIFFRNFIAGFAKPLGAHVSKVFTRPSNRQSGPNTLPSDVTDFTGRGAEVTKLVRLLRSRKRAHAAVGGMGGLGKSSLAVHVARLVAGRYPDGQLMIDLRGTKDALTPVAAMAEVVRAFEPQAQVPEDEAAAQALYRSVLAGRRVLLLLDDARDGAQARPLLPDAPAAALITSRQRIVLDGVDLIDLDAMSPDEARTLLRRIVPPERASDDDLDRIANLCAHLPLALRAAGTYLATYKAWSAADYIEALNERRVELKVGDDAALNVTAVLGLSAARLAAEHADLAERWKMLSVFPADFDLEAATAVAWDADADAARTGLGELEAASLLLHDATANRYRPTWSETSPATPSATARRRPTRRKTRSAWRWPRHATPRHATPRHATPRHAVHYLAVLARAKDLYLKGGEAVLAGLALFDLERRNVESGQRWATASAGENEVAARACSGYPDAGAYVLALRHDPREQVRWLEASAAAARRLGERTAEGAHLGNLAIARQMLGEPRRAIEFYEQQLEIVQEIGDRGGESAALYNMAGELVNIGERGRAIELGERSLEIKLEIEDPWAKRVRAALEEWRRGE